MVSKEQRDEWRAHAAEEKNEEWGSDAILALLDALDEMEKERDAALVIVEAAKKWQTVHESPENVKARVDYSCAQGALLIALTPDSEASA